MRQLSLTCILLIFIKDVRVSHSRNTTEPNLAPSVTPTLGYRSEIVAPPRCHWNKGTILQKRSPYLIHRITFTSNAIVEGSSEDESELQQRCCDLCGEDHSCGFATLNTRTRECGLTKLKTVVPNGHPLHEEYSFMYYAMGQKLREKAADRESSCDALCKMNHGQYEGQSKAITYRINRLRTEDVTSCTCSISLACSASEYEFWLSTEEPIEAWLVMAFFLTIFLGLSYGPSTFVLGRQICNRQSQEELVKHLYPDEEDDLEPDRLDLSLFRISIVILVRSIMLLFLLRSELLFIGQREFINAEVNMPYQHAPFMCIYWIANFECCLHMYFVLVQSSNVKKIQTSESDWMSRMSQHSVCCISCMFNVVALFFLAMFREIELIMPFIANISIVYSITKHLRRDGKPMSSEVAEAKDEYAGGFWDVFFQSFAAPFLAVCTEKYTSKDELSERKFISKPLIFSLWWQLLYMFIAYVALTVLDEQNASFQQKLFLLYTPLAVLYIIIGGISYLVLMYCFWYSDDSDFNLAKQDKERFAPSKKGFFVFLWYGLIHAFAILLIKSTLARVRTEDSNANWFWWSAMSIATVLAGQQILATRSRPRIGMYCAVMMKATYAFITGILLNDESVHAITFTHGVFLASIFFQTFFILLLTEYETGTFLNNLPQIHETITSFRKGLKKESKEMKELRELNASLQAQLALERNSNQSNKNNNCSGAEDEEDPIITPFVEAGRARSSAFTTSGSQTKSILESNHIVFLWVFDYYTPGQGCVIAFLCVGYGLTKLFMKVFLWYNSTRKGEKSIVGKRVMYFDDSKYVVGKVDKKMDDGKLRIINEQTSAQSLCQENTLIVEGSQRSYLDRNADKHVSCTVLEFKGTKIEVETKDGTKSLREPEDLAIDPKEKDCWMVLFESACSFFGDGDSKGETRRRTVTSVFFGFFIAFVLFFFIVWFDVPRKDRSTFNLSCMPYGTAAAFLVPFGWLVSILSTYCFPIELANDIKESTVETVSGVAAAVATKVRRNMTPHNSEFSERTKLVGDDRTPVPQKRDSSSKRKPHSTIPDGIVKEGDSASEFDEDEESVGSDPTTMDGGVTPQTAGMSTSTVDVVVSTIETDSQIELQPRLDRKTTPL